MAWGGALLHMCKAIGSILETEKKKFLTRVVLRCTMGKNK